MNSSLTKELERAGAGYGTAKRSVPNVPVARAVASVPAAPAASATRAADRTARPLISPAVRKQLIGLLGSGVAWGVLVSVILSIWVLGSLDGLAYYLTPVKIRGYAKAHQLLRPSAPLGQLFGAIGTVMMLVPFLYMARKRSRKGLGTTRLWLEIHLFCGIAGPALITFHTAFKFNGFVSAAYWSMVVVMLSGFVGRYLYVRIPRSIRGTELSRAELDGQADRLHTELLVTAGGHLLLDRIGRLERAAAPDEAHLTWTGLLFGEIRVRHQLNRLAHHIKRSPLLAAQQDALMRVAGERVMLLRRVAYLQRTKKAFSLWHVFHLPVVYLMLAITTVHIGLVFYMGYVRLPW